MQTLEAVSKRNWLAGFRGIFNTVCQLTKSNRTEAQRGIPLNKIKSVIKQAPVYLAILMSTLRRA